MAWSWVVIRTVPAGLSRMAVSDASSCSISLKCGLNTLSSLCPASVVDTLRVVRVSRRTPKRASSASIAWLSAERDKPSCAAARVKLRACATATKVWRSFRFSLAISEFSTPGHADFPVFSSNRPDHTVAKSRR
ncbi:hypothetical protein D3C87_1392100 [compost metagenome]